MPESADEREDGRGEEAEVSRKVSASWVGLDEEPIYTASQFISQFHKDLFIISFGMISPPPILGSPEERRRAIEEVDFVPIRTLARISVTPGAMEELIDVLQQNLARYRRRTQGEEG